MTITLDLSFPIGRFDKDAPRTSATRTAAIADIAALPARLQEAVSGLGEGQLDTPYRPGGWSVRQLVHHIADSHMNGFIRTKLALTEDAPTVKTYDQALWAALPDARLRIEPSLRAIDGVHERWTALWHTLRAEDFARPFTHPEWGPVTLDFHVHMYAWHSRHHVAHINGLRQREGW